MTPRSSIEPRWGSKPLSELVDFQRGLTYKKTDEVAFSSNAVLRANNIDRDTGRLNLDEIRYISDEIEVDDRLKVRPGTLLVCTASGSKSHLGKVALVEDALDFAFGGFMGLMIPRSLLDPRYLFYVTRSPAYGDFIAGLSDGANINNLKFGDLGRFDVPLPPLQEQKRIVAVLDQAFAALDRARALAQANLADAEEFWSRKLDELFNPDSGLPMGTIGDVALIQSGSGFPEKEQGSKAGAYPFYKVSDMNLPGNERHLVTANNYIDEPTRKRLRASIFPRGSIVFPKVGGAIATNKKRVVEAEGCVDNNVMGLIPDERVVLPEYLHEWLFSTDIYEFSNKANPPSITQGTVKEWPLFCPDLEEQGKIIVFVQKMRGGIAALRDHYRRTIADLADLRQSLLQKAFAGELT